MRLARPEGVIHYGYDDATGRHVKTWTTASEWNYGYDRLGRLAGVTESVRAGVTLGAADRLTTAYGYDLVGMTESVTVSRGGVAVRSTTNTYDPLRHWLVGVENKGEGGTPLSTFTYSRRADGQLKSLAEGVSRPGGGVQTGAATYEYDGLNRLTQESYDGSAAGSDYAKTYTLDLVGNRTDLVTVDEGQAAATTVSSYDERDRLVSEVAGGVTTKYGYDPNGSQTTKTVGGVLHSTQVWDARGRLASAVVDGKSVGYSYTEGGIRSGVVQDGVATGYVVDGMNPSGYSQVVEEWSSGANGSPVLVASFTYGAGLDPISTNTDRDGVPGTLESAVFLADGHSGVRQAVATAGGAVLLAQRFDAYGVAAATANAGNFSTPVGYRGERFDATLGQYYLRARLYDPQSGRFTSQDPFGGTYGDPLQSMRYGYAGANPVVGMDPSGMMTLGGLSVRIGTFGGMIGAVSGGVRGAKYGWRGAIAGAVAGGVAGFVVGSLSTLAIGGGAALIAGGIATPAAYASVYAGLLNLGLMQAGFFGFAMSVANASSAYDKGNNYDLVASMIEGAAALFGVGALAGNPVSTNVPFYLKSNYGAEALVADVTSSLGAKPGDFFTRVEMTDNGYPSYLGERGTNGKGVMRVPARLLDAKTSHAERMFNVFHEIGHQLQHVARISQGTESQFLGLRDGSRGYARDELTADTFAYHMVRLFVGKAASDSIKLEHMDYLNGYWDTAHGR